MECGCDDTDVLELHHIDVLSGYINRKIKKWKTDRVYRFALKHPEHYELLCRNCHYKRHSRKLRVSKLTGDEINAIWRGELVI